MTTPNEPNATPASQDPMMVASRAQPQRPARRASALKRGTIAAALIGGGFVLGAGTLASAGGFGPGMWPGYGPMGWHHGARIGMIQHAVRGALEDVGATTAQEDKVHDILAAAYTEIDKGGPDHATLRKQALDLLSAPTIDRAAVEKFRADRIAAIDTKSKAIVNAMVEAASQLTPEQRKKLVENAEARMEHRGGWGGWGGWRHHDEGPGDHDGPDRDHG